MYNIDIEPFPGADITKINELHEKEVCKEEQERVKTKNFLGLCNKVLQN
jgi:hypothetical protein